jgi:hypothetical protein
MLTPRKDHNQGRTSSLRCGRSTLILIFHGKIGAYREDGGLSGLLGAPGREPGGP